MLTPNSAYIDDLYADFLHDPNSVGEEWRAYFQARKDATISSMEQHSFHSNDDMIEVVQENSNHSTRQKSRAAISTAKARHHNSTRLIRRPRKIIQHWNAYSFQYVTITECSNGNFIQSDSCKGT